MLEIVNSIKYLGIHFFYNNSWHRTQKRISQHASYALHNLFIILNQVDMLNSEKCKLFDSLVGPILNYCAEVWGNHPGQDIERIHTKFCRKILCVKQSTNNDCLYGELGRLPMVVMRKIIMLRYWTTIINSDRSSLEYKVYSMLKTDADNHIHYNQSNWAYQIKIILDTMGMSNIWLSQNNMHVNIQQIKTRLIEIYKQSWYASINNSPKLETYCILSILLCSNHISIL